MLLSNQIAGWFDYQYLFKESINGLDFFLSKIINKEGKPLKLILMTGNLEPYGQTLHRCPLVI